MITTRGLAAGALAMLVLPGCEIVPHRPKELPALVRARVCEVGGEEVQGRPYRIPNATITMTNDAAWCWMDSTESWRGRVYGPYLTVTRPPQFGTLVTHVTEGFTRIAYRPNPGFVGTDAFQTRSQELNYEVNYHVSVTR